MAKLYARVTSRGRIVIPKPMRDELGIRRGDYLRFEVVGRRMVISLEKSRNA